MEMRQCALRNDWLAAAANFRACLRLARHSSALPCEDGILMARIVESRTVSTLAAVLTRSTVVAILATMFAWVVFFLIGFGHNFVVVVKEANVKIDEQIQASQGGAEIDFPPEDRPGFRIPRWVDVTSQVLYYPCPRTYDLDDRTIQIIASGLLTDFELEKNRLNRPLPPWGETLGVSLAFIALCLGLATLRMVTRDG